MENNRRFKSKTVQENTKNRKTERTGRLKMPRKPNK